MSTTIRHPISLEEVSELFYGRLPPASASRIRDHIRGCQQCEFLYERLAAAERALYHSNGEATPAFAQRVKTRLLNEPREPQPARRWWPAMTALAAVAATALLVVFVPAPKNSEYASRGDEMRLESRIGLRALRVRARTEGPAEVLDATSVRVRPDDVLKLLYSSDGTYRFITVYWQRGSAVEVALDGAPIREAVDGKLPGTVRVDGDVNGQLRLVAVFHNGEAEPPVIGAEARDGEEFAVRVLSLKTEASK